MNSKLTQTPSDDAHTASPPGDFSALNPDTVLDALFAAGFECDGRFLALNSYENRVYQLGLETGGTVVAKFYRPGRWSDAQILEEHAFVAELAAAELDVVPALLNPDGHSLQHFGDFRFALFRSQGGRAPELDRAGTLESMGRFLGQLHAIGSRQSFLHRQTLTVESFGNAALRRLIAGTWIPQDLRSSYESTAQMMLDGVRACYQRAGDLPYLRLHGDCHLGNVLTVAVAGEGIGERFHFLDFDDSCMGPAMQDMWMLLSGSRTEMQQQMCDILAGYEDFFEFDPRSLHLIEALRSLRLLHYSAWLALRWQDPAFQLAFPGFSSARYWQDKILEMREQIALMQEPVLRV